MCFSSRRRPWKHICIIEGFPNKIIALQFEWQWQHPSVSRLVGQNIAFNTQIPSKSIKKLQRGWKNRLDAISIILSVPLWAQMKLFIHFFNDAAIDYFRNKHNFELTPLLRVLPSDHSAIDVMHRRLQEAEVTWEAVAKPIHGCKICQLEVMMKDAIFFCSTCEASVHLTCAASKGTESCSSSVLIPDRYQCVICQRDHVWFDVAAQCLRRRADAGQIDESDDDDDGDGNENDHDDYDRDCDEEDDTIKSNQYVEDDDGSILFISATDG